MSLVFTIDDDDEAVPPESSDDDDFEMGDAAYELDETSTSGRWSTTTASKALHREKAAASGSRIASLDEKLKQRAAQI
eukprot:7171696-Prymnesium_polylepis.1